MTETATPTHMTPARTAQNSVVIRLAERAQVDPAEFLKTIKATLMPGASVSNEHLMAFLMVADRYRLDPIVRQIYAFPGKGGGIVPIVSIDGWYAIMNGHEQFDGLEFEDNVQDGKLVSITAKVYRKDRSHPIAVTEYMSECARNTEPWKQWPARMLRHKAAIQCARAAFGLAGLFDEDEGHRILEAEAVVSKPKASRREQVEALLAPRGNAGSGPSGPSEIETRTKDGPIATDDEGDPLDGEMERALEVAWQQGAAAERGAACPYGDGSDEEAAWVAGHRNAQETSGEQQRLM